MILEYKLFKINLVVYIFMNHYNINHLLQIKKLHDYSIRILGKDICVPILKINDNISEINFNGLPNKFFMKYNHGSGMNIICQNKKDLNFSRVIKKLNEWKNLNYGLYTTEF